MIRNIVAGTILSIYQQHRSLRKKAKPKVIHKLAENQMVPFGAAIGSCVTRAVTMNGANSVQLRVTVINLALTSYCLVGIETSNDNENWEADGVNTINVTSVGYFERRIAAISAKWVRVTYLTDAMSSALVAVEINVAEL